MNYRDLGNTGIRVSEVALGCEGFLGQSREFTCDMFDRAIAAGINAIDVYTPDPEARRNIGEALRGRRERFIIGGHLCSIWKDGQYLATRDLEEVQEGFCRMLGEFGTDYIDVGMIHYVDSDATWEKVVQNGILDYAKKLRQNGKIRHIGMSSHNPKTALKAVLSGDIEVLLFSVNPCYDLQPASENVEDIWSEKAYEHRLVNMDPDRRKLYEVCEEKGVGITVMKAFSGGDLLNAEMSPAKAALTPVQCISYCLTRPAAAAVMVGVRNPDQLQKAVDYETATAEEKDYASALASFPTISWEGHCMYCGHCAPCPEAIDVAAVTKFLNLTKAQGFIPETVREHYKALSHHASECIRCGACQRRCPFHVKAAENMAEAVKVFGF